MKRINTESVKDFLLMLVYYLWYSIKTYLIFGIILFSIVVIVLPLFIKDMTEGILLFILAFTLLFVPVLWIFMVIVRSTSLWNDPLRHKRELLTFGVMWYFIITGLFLFQISVLSGPALLLDAAVLLAWFCFFRAYQIIRDTRDPDRDLEEEED